MTEFTPIEASIGGMLIALAAIIMLLLVGKVSGISGIFSRLITGLNQPEVTVNRFWRVAFIAGLIISPLLAQPFGFYLPVELDASWLTLAIAGFLVGFGSKLGSGCTSGHGICGVGRFSKRSIIATCTFMASAIATVFIVKLITVGA